MSMSADHIEVGVILSLGDSSSPDKDPENVSCILLQVRATPFGIKPANP